MFWDVLICIYAEVFTPLKCEGKTPADIWCGIKFVRLNNSIRSGSLNKPAFWFLPFPDNP